MRDIGQANVLVKMVVEEISRKADCPQLLTGRPHGRSIMRVAFKEPRDELDVPFLAVQRWRGFFRVGMDRTK